MVLLGAPKRWAPEAKAALNSLPNLSYNSVQTLALYNFSSVQFYKPCTT